MPCNNQRHTYIKILYLVHFQNIIFNVFNPPACIIKPMDDKIKIPSGQLLENF